MAVAEIDLCGYVEEALQVAYGAVDYGSGARHSVDGGLQIVAAKIVSGRWAIRSTTGTSFNCRRSITFWLVADGIPCRCESPWHQDAL
jgi:hypothetical protein